MCLAPHGPPCVTNVAIFVILGSTKLVHRPRFIPNLLHALGLAFVVHLHHVRVIGVGGVGALVGWSDGQRDGTSTIGDGLNFVGLHFLPKRKSAPLFGVDEDAGIGAETIAA